MARNPVPTPRGTLAIARLALSALFAIHTASICLAQSGEGPPADSLGAPPSPVVDEHAGSPLSPGSNGVWWTIPLVTAPGALGFAPGLDSERPPVVLADIGERYGHTMIFDPVRQRFLLFGGTVLPNEFYFNDVWERPLFGLGEWTPLAVIGGPPPGRWGHSAVYDPIGDRMIVFGGRASGYLGDLWALSLSGTPAWQQVLPISTPPAARAWHTSVFDATRNRLVVHGGRNAISFLADVWSLGFDPLPPQWSPVTPSGTPPASRYGHVAVLDATRDRFVIYGGIGTQYYSDVWTLSLGSSPAWTLRSVTQAPGKRDAASAVLDATGNRMLVFGGRQPSGVHDQDLWSLDLGSFAWTLLSPSGALPGIRRYAAMAIDPVSRRAVLQGGLVGALYMLGDTRALTLGGAPAWTQLVPAAPFITSFTPTSGAAGTLVTITGGNFTGATTVTFNSAPSGFTVLSGSEIRATVPNAATSGRIQVTTSLGTATSASDFTVIPGLVSAPGANRYGAASDFDASRNRHVVVGGAYQNYPSGSPTYLNDAHGLRIGADSTWVRIDYSGTPMSARLGPSAVYDPVRDRLLIFGGHDGSYRNDLHELRFAPSPVMQPISVPGAPGPRDFHAAVYDPLRDRMLVFGGNLGGTALGDLWELTLGGTPAWRLLDAGSPSTPARMVAGMVLDPFADRLVLFGGWAPGSRNDLWQYPLSGPGPWTPIAVEGVLPGPRHSFSFRLDPLGQRAVLYSGKNEESQSLYSGTWELSLMGPPQWRLLSTGGGTPAARYGHLGIVDPIGNRMLLSGGFASGNTLPDVWRLQWDLDQPTPVALSLQVDAVTDEAVELTGHIGLAGDASCRLERSPDGAEWSSRAGAFPDASGAVHFVDREVTPGEVLYYRLALEVQGESMRSEEIRVQLPGAGDFALHGFSPNPAGARPRVSFQLAVPRAATVELLDIGGRRIHEHRIESPAIGRQTIEFANADLRPGIYFVRLTQGERSVVRRGIVAP